jgi:hypothetical protein
MTPERWGRIKDLFLRARLLARAERSAFFEAQCPGDPDMYSDVSRLLRASERSPADTAWRMLGGGVPVADDPRSDAPLAVHEAIGELEALDGLLYEIVVLHYFTGADVQSIAAELHVDATTVETELIVFKAWLSLALGR